MENFKELITQKIYISNLLSETVPKEYQNFDYIKNLQIPQVHSYTVLQLMLGKAFIRQINSLPENEIPIWKERLHQIILHPFDPDIEIIELLNFQPFTRTLILGLPYEASSSELKNKLDQYFQNISQALLKEYGSSFSGFYGSIEEDFFRIGFSYKKATQLQEHSYLIRLGEVLYYQARMLNELHPLEEYRLLSAYEKSLRNQDLQSCQALLHQIKDLLYTNFSSNSKITYVYKELFSITIRYLFDQPEFLPDEIDTLNDAITRFDQRFNDLFEMDVFYRERLHSILCEQGKNHCSYHISKALQIIHNEYMNPISLDSLSQALSISREHLSRTFKEDMEINFKEYLTRYRINVSKNLLTHSSLPIGEIAQKIGYSSASQFISIFKQIEGITPNHYRRSESDSSVTSIE
ncbi:MAG: helix-turn-helix transcriptional regulator [Vallitaleaceae bacterium]|nr:helix-turn-helix transcriptional regulator [Vallitaleaceae bacterium]